MNQKISPSATVDFNFSSAALNSANYRHSPSAYVARFFIGEV